jgi:outer membrane lipoprotein-sorting protein
MKTLYSLFMCVVLILGTGQVWADLSALDVMKEMEDLQDLGVDITVKVKITQKKPDQGVKVFESVYYRRDTDDSFLIVMTAPDNEKGNGYLRVGDNMWMYRRNTRTFQIMNRDQSIAGTDAKAGDLEKRKFTELYEPAADDQGTHLFGKETLGKAEIPVYKLEVQARVKDVEYPKVIYWVRQDNFLTMKEEAYSLSDTLMETSYYPKWTTVEGKYIPLNMIFVDEFEEGNRTVLELSGISLQPISDDIFTKAYLENLSK